MKIWLPILLIPFFTSCGIYRSNFDCPAGEGVGCASVGEVLDLIVEKEEGEDLFVNNKGTALLLRQEEESDLRRAEKRRKKLHVVREESGKLILVEETEKGS